MMRQSRMKVRNKEVCMPLVLLEEVSMRWDYARNDTVFSVRQGSCLLSLVSCRVSSTRLNRSPSMLAMHIVLISLRGLYAVRCY
jgi:hypothetical protein